MGVAFEFNFEKALVALVYLAAQQKSGRVTTFDKYKAAKLLFLADKYHLVRYGRPIFGDYYKALPWGPVPQQILDILHQLEDVEVRTPEAARAAEKLVTVIVPGHGYPCFAPREGFDQRALSATELQALDIVAERYGRMTFNDLHELTRKMPAYHRAWDRRGEAEAVRMEYEDFFAEDREAVPEAFEEMKENEALRRAFSDG